MSVDLAATILSGMIFFGVVYVAYVRQRTGKWPWED